MPISGEVAVCARCGHARQVHVSTATKIAKALRGRTPRATCGEPTDAGWVCPCRSRFHVV